MASFLPESMNIKTSQNIKDAIEIIKDGGVVITKTDTIYGFLADATKPESVERIYQIKQRELEKPFIILIPDSKFLDSFTAFKNEKGEKILNKKGITVLFKLQRPDDFAYLHRGTKKLAFRVPDEQEFLNFLKELDRPVVAPSANPSGLEPARNIKEAIGYFGDKVDLYIDRGEVEANVPSTIVEIDNGKIKILRHGSKQI